ncbi:hypothetical protein Acr_00g0007760 [Actinidia rufa]|uniref:Uncharacterized protein n=1 Tax=Actinidia rufa TaxID=165716 RepID=A0A7J0D8F7_9ERIC|nr:hypothetical protein Acr_00g0007760 [Actinidia rufa]
MECYFGSGVDDLAVPRDQEPLGRLPFPNSWSLWGVSATECFKSTNKYSIAKKSSMTEETNYNEEGLYEELDMDLSTHEAEHSSNSNRVFVDCVQVDPWSVTLEVVLMILLFQEIRNLWEGFHSQTVGPCGGVSATECFKSTNKYSIAKKSSMTEETNYNEEGLYEELDMDLSKHEAEHSSNSNRYLQEDSLQQPTSPWE